MKHAYKLVSGQSNLLSYGYKSPFLVRQHVPAETIIEHHGTQIISYQNH